MTSRLYKRFAIDRPSLHEPVELIGTTINIGDLKWRVMMPRAGVLFVYDEHGDVASAEAALIIVHRACEEKVPFDLESPPPAEMFRWDAHTDFLNPQYARGTSMSMALTASTSLGELVDGTTRSVADRFYEFPDMTNMVFRGTAVFCSDDRSTTTVTLRCVPRPRCRCS